MSPEEEQQLVYKAQTGDQEAVGLLYDSITPKLFGYLLNTVRHKALAEDLLSSTWLKAIAALPKFERRGVRFSAWVFAIARNECRQHWRQSKHQASDATEFEIPYTDQSHVDNKILVEQILALLSEDDRELIRLRFIADLSIKDTAQVLNLNLITVRVRLHRALARARSLLAEKL